MIWVRLAEDGVGTLAALYERRSCLSGCHAELVEASLSFLFVPFPCRNDPNPKSKNRVIALWKLFFSAKLAIPSRVAVRLDQIVPWGRTAREYELMFRLTAEDLSSGILDCGGGPASFNAEFTARGHRVISVDPIYSFSGAEILGRFEATVPTMLSEVRSTPDDWTWTYHRNPDDLCATRRAALDTFLTDYEAGLRDQRYIVGELPILPFNSGQFGLAVCSHLLFLYSDLLSAGFHVQSVLELCRVAREVRIFPLLSLDGKPSPHVVAVREALAASGWNSEIVSVDYELQRGGNEMLRVFTP